MLLLSKYPIKTLKSAPKISDNRSTSLLLQAGFIRQEMAGVYHFLPLGLRVIERIKNIIREEINSTGGVEMQMSSLGSKAHWTQTGRWDEVDVLFHLPASDGREYALNPTHEEMVTPIAGEFINSYKDLDTFALYQFQTKFRNEKRAKSGLLRGREFIMKDLYSFHRNQQDLQTYFDEVQRAYVRIFERLGIGTETYYTFAGGGDFSKYSYEFQTKLPIGEDTVYVCSACRQGHNDELYDEVFEGEIFTCASCGAHEYERIITSEVGNIFQLGSRFSDAFGVKFNDENGKMQSVPMGCYGIGVSRVMGVIAEYFMDDAGLVWPENIAPATHYIIVQGDHLEQAIEFAKTLESEGKSVIVDDREKVGFGQKAGDAELLGIPYRVVFSDKTFAQGGYELKSRTQKEGEIIKFDKK